MSFESRNLRVSDWVTRARRGEIAYTRFLDPAAAQNLAIACREEGLSITTFGGYEGAERVVAALTAQWDAPPAPETFPITCVRVSWNARFGEVSHRDLLGSILGLGVVRDVVGDIRMAQGYALVYVIAEIHGAVLGLSRAGRVAVEAKVADDAERSVPEAELETVSRTVKGLRMDAVLAAGLDLSRDKAQALIRAGLVKRNHVPDPNPDRQVSAGDVFSVRGYGRVTLAGVGGESRKSRVFIEITRSKR